MGGGEGRKEERGGGRREINESTDCEFYSGFALNCV
jgi:hypothetical protein